jgi:catechol 2,3-dioxygenase-like lactoylglutathione lyase family enzyme
VTALKNSRTIAGKSGKEPTVPEPLFRKIDCLMLNVGDLDAALRFYRDKLGLALVWKTGKGAGLRVGESELVLNQGPLRVPETDITVESAEEAARRVVEAGGTTIAGPFDTKIGKGVVVADPWGNQLVLLDTTKGLLKTDADGNVVP